MKKNVNAYIDPDSIDKLVGILLLVFTFRFELVQTGKIGIKVSSAGRKNGKIDEKRVLQ